MTQESVEQRKCENCGEFGKCCMEAESQEPVAWLYESPMPDGSVFVGASAERLTVGIATTPDTVEKPLYTHPKRTKVVFPTMLRKMWSGSEVQAWLDENVNKEKT